MKRISKLGLLAVALFIVCFSYADNRGIKNKQEVYSCNFETQDLFNQLTIINSNDDGVTWAYYDCERTGRKCANYNASTSSVSGDEWLITPTMDLIGGKEYTLTFEACAMTPSRPEKMSIYYGKGATVAAQTNLINEYTFSNGWDGGPKPITITFTPSESGQYNLGFWENSEQYTVGLRLYSIKVETNESVINNDLAAKTIIGNLTPEVNTESIYFITIENNGAMAQNGYKVMLVDDNETVLSEITMNEAIEPTATKVIEIPFTPTTVGSMNIRGKVVFVEDENQENNITEKLSIQVMPKNESGTVFTCSFDSQAAFNQWTIVDANNDDKTWTHFNLSGEIPHAKYSFSLHNNANDWLISPAIKLEKDKGYEVYFEVRAPLGTEYTEKLSVYYGQGTTPEVLTNLLGEYSLNKSGMYEISAFINPTIAGNYNVGFKAHSPKMQYDIDIYKVTVREKLAIDLAAVSVTGNNKIVANTPYDYTVKVKNTGTETQNSFKVQLIDDNNKVLSEKTVDQQIAIGATLDVALSFTTSTTGVIAMRGKVILAGDRNSENDITTPINIEVTPKSANELVYECPFDNEAQFNEWTVINVNEDELTWKFYYDKARYSYSKELPANDWMVSKSVKLDAGKAYRLSFDIQGSASFIERVKVYYGQGSTVAAQTNFLGEFTTIAWWDTKSIVFIPSTTGDYNIGILACSDADQYNLELDNVILEKLVDNDLSSIQTTGTLMPIVKKEYKYDVTVRNNGSVIQNNYKVTLLDENNSLLGETVVNEPLEMNKTKIVSVSFTPQTVGEMKLKGKVTLNGDQDPANDESPLFVINVQPESDEEWIVIEGDKANISIQLPFNFHYATSTVQTIYKDSDMRINKGMITKINYTYAYGGDVDVNESVKVYLANTTTSDLSKGWIAEDKFTLAYEGTILIQPDQENMFDLELDLIDPFIYDGSNICVMTVREMGPESIPFVYSCVHPIKEELTRQYFSSSLPFDFINQGSTILYRPDIKFFVNTADAGSLSGKTTANNVNLADVKLTLTPQNLTTQSKADGTYSFSYVPRGNYSITASLFGYENSVVDDVIVSKDANTVKDISLSPLPRFTVSGTVKNIDGENVSGATVKISGYDSYEITTNANGVFSIADVYKANDYTVTITKQNLATYSNEFNVVSANVDLGVITLNDLVIPPINVMAKASETKVDVSWLNPVDATAITYQLDDGSSEYGWRINPNLMGALGNEFKTTKSGVIESIDVYGVFEGGAGSTRTVWVEIYNKEKELIGLGEEFIILGNKWMNVSVPYVSYDGDFYAMVKFSDINETTHYLGFDEDGPSVGKNLAWYMDDNGWVNFGGTANGVFLLRANVIESKNEQRSYPEITNTYKSVENKMDISAKVSAIVNSSESQALVPNNCKSDSKGIKGYKVWRFESKDQNQENKWTLLTQSVINTTNYADNTWSSVSDGIYKYAVRAVYSNDLTSVTSISNIVTKGMEFEVTVSVRSNTENPTTTGAMVILTNKDNVSEHVYSDVISSTGSVVFNNVWKGIYTVQITHEGFETITATNVSIDKNTSLDYQLIETIVKPYNLEADCNGNSCVFTWNNIPSIFDDFDRYDDFEINAPGSFNWTYIDGDAAITAAIAEYDFPGAGAPMAYIVFNPNATTPSVLDVDPIWAAHSGDKYLASFCASPAPNDDWIISPALSYNEPIVISFWARSLVEDYGLERFRVVYSTTGDDMSNFTNVLTPGNYEEAPSEWTKFSYKVPAGAKYVAISCVSNDAFVFMVDDLFIGPEETRAFVNYEVYLDGEKQSQTNEKSFTFTDLINGPHVAGVKAIYSSGESEISTVTFMTNVGIEDIDEYSVKIYPNPVVDIMTIEGEYSQLEIYNVSGKLIMTANGENKLDVSSLAKGVYLIKIANNEKTTTIKFAK